MLHIGTNNINDTGAQAIAEALKVNTSLKAFYIAHNKIGPTGAQAFAEALKINTSLNVLNISLNNIGDTGAQSIAEALNENTSLTELKLIINHIGNTGAKAIADAIVTNIWITDIECDSMSQEILHLCERNRILKKSRETREWSFFSTTLGSLENTYEGPEVYRKIHNYLQRVMVAEDWKSIQEG
jgi:Ran GTPase-activating protein (RanGAP) involved in mRNA processing and transport